MPPAMRKAMIMPDWPPMALPIKTRSRVRLVSRSVVLIRFMVCPPYALFVRRVIKKTFTRGMVKCCG